MKILVLLKMVPDIVEELEIGADGRSLDQDAVRPIVSERDDHALEQALLLKERSGATVTALALEAPEVDEVLFTSLAKGADRAVKVTGLEAAPGSAAAADVLAAVLPAVPDLMPVDLVLAGCQAISTACWLPGSPSVWPCRTSASSRG
jgi:electron transfer flavoprotein beta subunit